MAAALNPAIKWDAQQPDLWLAAIVDPHPLPVAAKGSEPGHKANPKSDIWNQGTVLSKTAGSRICA